MEIDFLGLNSTKYEMQQENSKSAYTAFANGGEEISLSLSTSSSPDCQREEILDFQEKKSWKFLCDKMMPTTSASSNNTLSSMASYQPENAPTREQPRLALVTIPHFYPSSATGFLYLDDRLTNLRNVSGHRSQPASLAILYSSLANVSKDAVPEKVDNTVFMVGNACDDAQKCTRGYTPTVAMARRATLARFLEKRSHRLTQTRTSHLIGKASNDFKACGMNIFSCKKNRKDSIIQS